MPVIKPALHILTVWRLRLLLCTLLPSFFSALFFGSRGPIWWSCTIVWVAAFCYFYIFYYPIKLKKLSFGGNDRCLLIHCGVIYTRVKAIPYESIQYLSVTSSPLERLFGICSLVLYMAGASAYLPGLTPEEAETIRADLARRAQGGAS